jgi:uncharacterized low-complexity protein
MSRARSATLAVVAAFMLGVAGCGEEDVERGVDQGSEQVEEAGRDAEKAGEDAAGEAKEGAEDAEREAGE